MPRETEGENPVSERRGIAIRTRPRRRSVAIGAEIQPLESLKQIESAEGGAIEGARNERRGVAIDPAARTNRGRR